MAGRFFLVGKIVESGSHGGVVAVLFIVNASLILVKRFEGPDMTQIRGTTVENEGRFDRIR
jgi:hypothetical protein